MDFINLVDVFALSNQIALHLAHFARGVYPCLDETFYSTYPVNRMFCILANPNKAKNFLCDKNERHEFVPGVIYLAPAFHPVVFRLDSDVRFISIHFNLELLYCVDLFSSIKKIYREPMPEMIERLNLCFESEDKMLTALELRRCVYEMVVCFFRKYRPEGFDVSARFASFKPAMEHIAAHCVATTRVDTISKVMGMSRETFSRNFSAKTGISPKNFLARQLAHRAAELLMKPRITAREVSCELEFSSEFVFSRFFKKQLGVSPRAYQRQYGGMVTEP